MSDLVSGLLFLALGFSAGALLQQIREERRRRRRNDQRIRT